MTDKSNFTPDEWKLLLESLWRRVSPFLPPSRAGCGAF